VAFLERLVQYIEQRRANVGAGFYRLTEVLIELDHVTEQLRVRDQVRASLDKEIGSSDVLRAIRWLRDYYERGIREELQMPDLEDEYEKAARIASRYLDVYDTVLKARADAEESFVSGGKPADDHGLRILSTPFLLACVPATDERRYPQWRGLPLELQAGVHDELLDVKRRFVPGGQLDAGEGSFDRQTLRGITYHDVFRRLWKQVRGSTATVQGGVTNFDARYWRELALGAAFGGNEESRRLAGEGIDRLTGANEIEGLGSQDVPLERFRHHAEERKKLLLKFLEHYLLTDDRFAGLLDSAKKLAAHIAELCGEAGTEVAAATTGAAALEEHAADLLRTLNAVETRLAETPALFDTVTQSHASAESGAAAVGEAASAAEKLSLALCNKLKAARAATDPEIRTQLLWRRWTHSPGSWTSWSGTVRIRWS